MTLQQAVADALAALADEGFRVPASRIPDLAETMWRHALSPPADREAERARGAAIRAWIAGNTVPLPAIVPKRERVH